MKKHIKATVVLVCICAVMAVLLALTNAVTAPIIKKNQDAAANEALLEVMPNGEGFEKVEFDAEQLPKSVTDVYSEKNGGYVVTLTVAGYQPGMVIMCGVNADGTVSGVVCLSSAETLGYEKTYGESFVGKNAEGVDGVDTVGGATKTTAGYKNAIKDALNTAIILGGGSVDIRTEEEILNDNLSAALPTGEGKFEKLFITEVLEGIDAVYAAENGAGLVYVIGEEFIGVAKDTTPENATVAAAHASLSASTETDVDMTALAALDKLISVKRTSTGNYVMEVKGDGFGITGDPTSEVPLKYQNLSGKPIVVRVSMTADGKIIDTLTVSQEETAGIGDVCADEKFYGQFDGKTESDYRDVDAIAGATWTTKGYLQAIEVAFNALEILEGGSN